MDFSIVINLVTLLTVGGGLYALATVQDNRMKLMLENIKAMLESNSKTNEAWEKLAENKAHAIEILETRCDRKDKEIEDLYKDIANLRNQLDDCRTEKAKAVMLQCKLISCTNRIPPFAASETQNEQA